MKPLHIYLLLLIVALSFSCSKEKPEPPTYYLTQDIYDYVIFPVGSWWVYRDSATGGVDTVKVVSQEKKIVEHDGDSDGNIDYKWEEVIQYYSKSFPIYDTVKYINTAEGLNDAEYCDSYLDIKNNLGIINIMVYYDIASMEKQNAIYSYIKFYKYLDTLKIENLTFYKIKIFNIHIVKDGSVGDFSYEITKKYNGNYCYSKNIGLIKKVHKDSLTWELINYHINK